ncbi:ATP-binding protein, partial [Methanoregula sp.]|uniref:ATP-binding protein n=1 Tax=Methanoregula sp. TaxID=2052170 RepID=UPI000CC27EFF
SHLDFSRIARTTNIEGLEIFADPLLEDVFFILMENVLIHGKGATGVKIHYRKEPDGSLVILFEDNGPGIPSDVKERIFSQDFNLKGGRGLFLAREILSITGISLRETGAPGAGARFEMTVPEGAFRLPDNG